MSAAVASSRGNTRPMKEKHGKSTPQTQTKSEGPPQKVQASVDPDKIRVKWKNTFIVIHCIFKSEKKNIVLAVKYDNIC